MNCAAFGQDRERQLRGGGYPANSFTIVELLVAMTILSFILVVTLTMVGQMSNVWKKSSSKIESFQGARLAFEAMTRCLSQVTLNTYVDYDDANNPQNYLRKSDLQFLSGPAGGAARGGVLPGVSGCGQAVFFEAPVSTTSTANWSTYGAMDSLLNTCGYYVDFTPNNTVPAFVTAPNPYRYRLMQLIVPTETANSVYPSGPAPATASDWTTWFASINWFASFKAQAIPLADNIILLVVRPQDPSATPPDINSPSYAYDTTLNATTYPQPQTANQLPPVIQVTMVAIDEPSALRLITGSTQPTAITSALSGKFTDTTKYAADLASLVASLDAARIQYRVFSSAVPVLESKWSK